MRSLLPLALLAAALAALPLAAAQEGNETDGSADPDDKAWVEDCPPDMMCAYSGGGAEEPRKDGEPADDGRVYKGEDRPTYDGDCGGEVCAYGDPDCIECSGPVDSGSTCMDGAQENETCRDDVQYIGGPSRGPADGSCEFCRGGTDAGAPADPVPAPAETAGSGAAARQVPGLALAGTLGALAAAGVLLRRR